jgi:hypothetical protein
MTELCSRCQKQVATPCRSLKATENCSQQLLDAAMPDVGPGTVVDDVGLSQDELMTKYGDHLGTQPNSMGKGGHPIFTMLCWVKSASSTDYWTWVKEHIASAAQPA